VGNTTTSAGVTVTVNNAPDTTLPAVHITGPLDGTTVSGSVVLAAFASDNVGVASVQFQLNGVNAGPAVTAAPYILSFNTHTVATSPFSLTAAARDPAGTVPPPSPVSVTVDTLPPTVSGQTPAAGATAVVTSTAVTASFSKPIQPATLSFVLTDPGNNTV